MSCGNIKRSAHLERQRMARATHPTRFASPISFVCSERHRCSGFPFRIHNKQGGLKKRIKEGLQSYPKTRIDDCVSYFLKFVTHTSCSSLASYASSSRYWSFRFIKKGNISPCPSPIQGQGRDVKMDSGGPI